MPAYESVTLREVLEIKELFSLHYFEYAKDFVFEGEQHDFWEFLCVDSGRIRVTAGDKTLMLNKNEMIFHKPNEFHALRADGISAPNLIVVSFRCDASCMDFFENRIVTVNETERFYLGQMLQEGRRSFKGPFNDPYILRMEHNKDADFGSEQIIKSSIELLLISIYRRYHDGRLKKADTPMTHPSLRRGEDELLQEIIVYMKNNIYGHLNVEQICRGNSVGRSQLQKLFHEKYNCGVIDYFCRMKIEMAQQMIRETDYTFAQVADMLGYSSYQYFSLQFKKYTQMSPREYSYSIKYFSKDRPEAKQ